MQTVVYDASRRGALSVLQSIRDTSPVAFVFGVAAIGVGLAWLGRGEDTDDDEDAHED